MNRIGPGRDKNTLEGLVLVMVRLPQNDSKTGQSPSDFTVRRSQDGRTQPCKHFTVASAEQ